jgi:hypothetical protein
MHSLANRIECVMKEGFFFEGGGGVMTSLSSLVECDGLDKTLHNR